MNAQLDKLRRLKRILNALMILCIPFGLFFFGVMVTFEMSYEDFDLGSRLTGGKLSENDMRIMHKLRSYTIAMHAIIYVFVILLTSRVGLEMIAKRNVLSLNKRASKVKDRIKIKHDAPDDRSSGDAGVNM